MTVFWLILFFAAAAALFFLFTLRRKSLRGATPDELASFIQPLDLEAFRNLVSPAEEQYLRSRLGPRAFRRIQRGRLRAALGYVRATGANAALLLRLGEASRLHPDPAVVAEGRALAQQAARLRLLSLLLLPKLYLGILWPQFQFPVQGMAERYEQLSVTATRVCRLREPGGASRLAALLSA